MKLLHDGRSLYLESANLGLVLSANTFHTVLNTACFLFQTATEVSIQFRCRGTDAGRETLRHGMTWRQNHFGPEDQIVLVVCLCSAPSLWIKGQLLPVKSKS